MINQKNLEMLEISDLDIKRSKEYIDLVANHIRDYWNQNPELPPDQLMEKMENEFVDSANQYYFIIDDLASINSQLLSIDYLVENKDFFDKEYGNIKNKKNLKLDTEFKYDYDIKKSSKLLLKAVLKILREKTKNYNLTIDSKEEYKFLQRFIPSLVPKLEKQQKKNYIKIFNTAFEFFNKYDILEKLNFQYNRQLKNLWLDDLCYGLDADSSKPNDIGLKKLLSTENLSNMPLDDLTILNASWQNKYAKELNNIGFAYFAFKQLNLYKQLSAYKFNFSDEDIKNLLLKYTVLESACGDIYNNKSKHNRDTTFPNLVKQHYTSYFNNICPNFNNEFDVDIEQCINPILASKNIYSIKSNILCGTIANLINSKKIKNWGYIDDNDGKGQNSIQADSPFILIGLDYPGLNRPLKVHVRKELLQTFLINTKQTNMIPVYSGKKDFYNNFEYLKTHILAPLEKSHKSFLRKNKDINPDDFRHDFISHIRFLAKPNEFPEHLKENVDGKLVHIKKFINLSSGDIFVEDPKTKKLIPEDEFYSHNKDQSLIRD